MNRSPVESFAKDRKPYQPKIEKMENAAACSAIRVCDFCGKTFTSGKALGGHRRFHLHMESFGGDGSKIEKTSVVENHAAASPATRLCDFCGKTFTSGKALGGHRRFHLQALRKEQVHTKVKIRLPNHHLSKSININNSKTSSECVDDIKMENLTANGKPSCCLCKKDFPSMKSLFGHMRSHPEREWRGVFPPLTASHQEQTSSNSDSVDNYVSAAISSSSTESSPVAVDLSKSFSSWEKTGKRGRKGIGGTEAAHCLILLSRAEYCHCPPPGLSRAVRLEEAKSPRVPIPGKKRKIDDLPTEKHVKKIKVYRRGSLKLGNNIDHEDGDGDEDSDVRLNVEKASYESGYKKSPVFGNDMDDVEEEEDGNWGKDECEKDMKDTSDKVTTDKQDDVNCIFQRKMLLLEKKNNKKKKKKKRKFLKLKSSDSESVDRDLPIKTLKAPDGYKCGICGRSFSTFQALGGHRSSHNKKRNTRTTMDESIPPDATVAEENNCANQMILQRNDTEESEDEGLVGEEATKIFSATFIAAAEAVGGHHKRYHSTGLADEMPLSEAASSDEVRLSHPHDLGDASQSGPKLLEFDLNEPYTIEDQATDKHTCY